MKNNIVACNKCSGMCCIQPPQLESKKEVLIALHELHAPVFAVQHPSLEDRVFFSIDKKDGACPFLVSGQCSIYDNRFETCKRFACEALDQDLDSLFLENGPDKAYIPFLTNKNQESPGDISLPKSFAFKYNIPVVSIDEGVQRIGSTSTNTVIGMLFDTLKFYL